MPADRNLVHRGESESRIAQHLQDALCKVFIDLTVAWNGLRNLGGGVVIPVVFAAVSN